MSWGFVALAGATVVTGYMGSKSNEKSAKAIAEASKMSPQELALMEKQLGLIDLSEADRALLRPFMLENMGFVEEDGGIRRLTEKERTASMTKTGGFAYRNLLATQGLLEEALAGGYSDPQFESNVEKQRTELETGLSQRLGPNWRNTTPGIQSLAEFNKRVDISRSSIGNERIGLLTSISQTERGLQKDFKLKDIAGMKSFYAPDSGLSGTISNAMQPFQFTRGLKFEGAMQESANQAQLYSDIGGAIGYMGSNYLYSRGLQPQNKAGVLPRSGYSTEGLYYQPNMSKGSA